MKAVFCYVSGARSWLKASATSERPLHTRLPFEVCVLSSVLRARRLLHHARITRACVAVFYSTVPEQFRFRPPHVTFIHALALFTHPCIRPLFRELLRGDGADDVTAALRLRRVRL